MERKQRRERRLKEEAQNGRYYYCTDCNYIAQTGSERINQTFLKEKVLVAEEVLETVRNRKQNF